MNKYCGFFIVHEQNSIYRAQEKPQVFPQRDECLSLEGKTGFKTSKAGFMALRTGFEILETGFVTSSRPDLDPRYFRYRPLVFLPESDMWTFRL